MKELWVFKTFLVMIPKKGIVEDLKDLMPINLVVGPYKILAKVLANRLKKVIGKVCAALLKCLYRRETHPRCSLNR